MLMNAFKNCKNEEHSLVGLELQESPLRLSCLCRHALLGHQHHPENHSDVICCYILFFTQLPYIFQLISAISVYLGYFNSSDKHTGFCKKKKFSVSTCTEKALTFSPLSPFSWPWISAC